MRHWMYAFVGHLCCEGLDKVYKGSYNRSDKCCGNWSHRAEAPLEGTSEQFGPLGGFRLGEV